MSTSATPDSLLRELERLVNEHETGKPRTAKRIVRKKAKVGAKVRCVKCKKSFALVAQIEDMEEEFTGPVMPMIMVCLECRG